MSSVDNNDELEDDKMRKTWRRKSCDLVPLMTYMCCAGEGGEDVGKDKRTREQVRDEAASSQLNCLSKLNYDLS